MFGQSSYHLCKINGIFWLGSWGPDRFRDLPNSLSQTHMALLPVPLFVPSNIDFTTFVLSCLTPRLFKYFPKIMSHVWVCSFSRMNHCERTWASERRISIWGQRLLALLHFNWQALKRAFFQKAAAGLACVSHCAQNSPLGLVRFSLLASQNRADAALFAGHHGTCTERCALHGELLLCLNVPSDTKGSGH